jgi:hypothetical protein
MVLVVLVIPTPHGGGICDSKAREAVARPHWRMLFDYCTATETLVV